MATNFSGVIVAGLRAVRTRADVDHFDMREAKAFLGYKLFVWGVPAIAAGVAVWMMRA